MPEPAAPKGITIPLGANWKTNLGGVASILTALATGWLAYQNGNLTPEMITALLTALSSAIIGFSAKDNNVTGGTKQQ